MIDIADINRRLVEQDHELRARFAGIVSRLGEDPTAHAICELIAEGLAAIHERQGNLVTLMLQSDG